jgi:hypothetical protein
VLYVEAVYADRYELVATVPDGDKRAAEELADHYRSLCAKDAGYLGVRVRRPAKKSKRKEK